MGRLRPGAALAEAQARLPPAFHEWVEATAGNDRERESLPVRTVKQGAGGLAALRRQYVRPLYGAVDDGWPDLGHRLRENRESAAFPGGGAKWPFG